MEIVEIEAGTRLLAGPTRIRVKQQGMAAAFDRKDGQFIAEVRTPAHGRKPVNSSARTSRWLAQEFPIDRCVSSVRPLSLRRAHVSTAARLGIGAIPLVTNGLQQFLEDWAGAYCEFGSGFWKFFYRVYQIGYATP